MTKTNLFLLIAFTFLLSCSNPKQNRTDLEKMNLAGKVKSLCEFQFVAEEKFGEVTKGKRERPLEPSGYSSSYDSCILFNKNGYFNETTLYKSDGYLYQKNVYKYNDKENLIEIDISFSEMNLNSKFIYQYDDKGNRIEEAWYNTHGTLGWKNIYKYDEKGNQREGNNYYSDGKRAYRYTYDYDNEGNLIEANWGYNEKGSIYPSRTSCKYDGSGNRIEKSEFFADGTVLRTTYKYDKRRNIIEVNDTGKESGKKTTFKYEYDKIGNWVKRITYEDDNPKWLREREIEYH